MKSACHGPPARQAGRPGLRGERCRPDPRGAYGRTKHAGELAVIDAHPEWVGECRQLGLSVNVWTVNAPRDMERYVRMGVDFITTNRPVEALRMVAR